MVLPHIASLSLLACAVGAPPERLVLDNGATVILLPIGGVGHVGVESFYRAGFLDEPAGMAQATHLLEHIACMGATPGRAAGEAFALINERGMANAETLATFTHYDYVLPAADLALAIETEAGRLRGLGVTADIVRQEAPRCYAEAANIEASPMAPLFKFGVMAAHQAWRHGADRALIKGGLEEIPLGRLSDLHRDLYNAANLTLVIAGGFERDAALALVEDHIAPLDGRPAERPAIDYSALPDRMTVEWDSARPAAIVAFPPPADPAERLAVGLWGSLLTEKMMSDAAVKEVAAFTITTNLTWPAGELPLFVFATAADGASAAETARVLSERLAALAPLSDQDRARLRAMVAEVRAVPEYNQATVTAQTRSLVQMGRSQEEAAGLVVGNAALQLGIRDHLLGADPAALIAAAERIIAGDLDGLIARLIEPERMFVTLLEPAEQVSPSPPARGTRAPRR